MPTYEHLCTKCNHEWEQFYSIKDPVPDTCPSCSEVGGVKRLISGGSGKGKVELSGQEYVDKVMADAASIKREAYRNENVMANLVGESKYHSDRVRR
jgi:putative FmdB family regulatory protein